MIVSGTHFLISKRLVLVVLLFYAGGAAGVWLSNRGYARRAAGALLAKTQAVEDANAVLKFDKDEYESLFSKLAWQMDESGAAGAPAQQHTTEDIDSFHRLAQTLQDGLMSTQTKLEEKEFQLWEKEGLLEYQEERLMHSAEREAQMAAFIRSMAAQLLSRNQELPEGLEDAPFFDEDGETFARRKPDGLRGLAPEAEKPAEDDFVLRGYNSFEKLVTSFGTR
ncbi:hypothetical protein M885DRAFT_464861 [Pelagophyceae sp. CCMP2097]|nr:hypothetical protein M885DRAFT_464861 [Pelagophyceae sp. CCMP2097]|mmetsp:Transcript_26245/g.88202  ORF Transcript_26245/g.88202 Transcript_26245/m.88202 type:complete len:223 (-) Transcript_26245:22-690(-)